MQPGDEDGAAASGYRPMSGMPSNSNSPSLLSSSTLCSPSSSFYFIFLLLGLGMDDQRGKATGK